MGVRVSQLQFVNRQSFTLYFLFHFSTHQNYLAPFQKIIMPGCNHIYCAFTELKGIPLWVLSKGQSHPDIGPYWTAGMAQSAECLTWGDLEYTAFYHHLLLWTPVPPAVKMRWHHMLLMRELYMIFTKYLAERPLSVFLKAWFHGRSSDRSHLKQCLSWTLAPLSLIPTQIKVVK